jgi:hypothetical protein
MKPKENKRRMAYACFDCRKAFRFDWVYPSARAWEAKKQIGSQIRKGIPVTKPKLPSESPHLCPQCRKQLHCMGRYLRAPKMSDKEAWEAAELLIMAGYDYSGYQGRMPRKPADAHQYTADRALRSPGGRLSERIKRKSKRA